MICRLGGLLASGALERIKLSLMRAVEWGRLIPRDVQLQQLGLRGVEGARIVPRALGRRGRDGELLAMDAVQLFAEGHLVAPGSMELHMMGLVVAIHQHLLIGEADLLIGLLPDLFVQLLLLALLGKRRAVPLSGAPEMLGRGAIGHLSCLWVLLLGLGLRWTLICLPLIIPTRTGLRADDGLEEIHHVLQGRALAGGLALAPEAAAVDIFLVPGPAAITGILEPEVGHDLEGQLVHWDPLRLVLRVFPVIGGHLHFLERGHEHVGLHIHWRIVVDDGHGPFVVDGPVAAPGVGSLGERDLLVVFPIGWRLRCLVVHGLIVTGRIGTGGLLELLLAVAHFSKV